MNDLKKLITAHLRKTEEATAKQIAAAIGYRESQSSVNNALNALRTDGTVECEKRKGKGNELIYWLASAAQDDDEAMPEADAGLLAMANRELSNRVRLLLESIGSDDDSGDGILAAAAMAKIHRDKAKLAEGLESGGRALKERNDELVAEANKLSHDLKNAEAGGRMMKEHADRMDEIIGRLGVQLTNIEGKDIEHKVAQVCHDLIHATNQRDAWREMAAMFGKETPVEIGAFISELQNRITALEANAAIPDAPRVQQKRQAMPRRPFTVTGLTGYHATNGRVTLFVDRRLSARSITLPADKLNQLAEMARGA